MQERVTHEELMRYLDGEVAPDERNRIEASVESSTELRREVAVFRAMKVLFKLAGPPANPEASQARNR